MIIAEREIGESHRPYIVAEMSCNHNGSLDQARRIIDAATHAGVDAVKLQCFTASEIAEARGGAGKVLADGPWAGMTLGELYSQAQTPREWFPALVDHAKACGIALFSSAFDEDGVDFLDGFAMPAIKISSFDLTNLALIRKAASTGRPLIISTGMATIDDVGEAIIAAQCAGANLALLHCVSEYPCPVEKANLARIDELRRHWGTVGFSDHTKGLAAAVAAVAKGACIIEKHITIDGGGPDGAFSMNAAVFRDFVKRIHDAWLACRPSVAKDSYAGLRVSTA